LVDKPDCALNDVTSKQRKGGIRYESLDGVIHALFKAARTITLSIAVSTSRELSIAGCVGSSVRATADVLGAIIVCADFVRKVDVNVTIVDDLQRSLAAGWRTSSSSRFGRGERNSVGSDSRVIAQAEDCSTEKLCCV